MRGAESPAVLGPEVLPVSPLQAEINKQAVHLSTLNLHRRLGQTPEAYLASFKLPENFNSFKEAELSAKMQQFGLDIPVVVDPRVPWREMTEVLHIKNPVPEREVTDLSYAPDKPYLIWTHDHTKWPGKSVATVRKEFGEGIVGATMLEAISLYVQYSDLFTDHAYTAAGTITSLPGDSNDSRNEASGYLANFSQDLRIASGVNDHGMREWVSMGRGREIVVLRK